MAFPPQNGVGSGERHPLWLLCSVCLGHSGVPLMTPTLQGFMAGTSGGEIWGNPCSCCMVRGKSPGGGSKIFLKKHISAVCGFLWRHQVGWSCALHREPARTWWDGSSISRSVMPLHSSALWVSAGRSLQGRKPNRDARGRVFLVGWGLGLSSRIGRGEHLLSDHFGCRTMGVCRKVWRSGKLLVLL